ncbi:DNA-directed RNA polymerase subunit omega [Ligilactobacillus sp. WC1T17]|uniref:DNA-directed RNA polymerase subunit omega n=1 Tax=Ligilactobacillus ruminis TaxID=1623 RepID=A0ABY1ABN8_9LACO|nr:DNA-directed RNA polymerase subunit omega [Ligilactobacillus ruminis]
MILYPSVDALLERVDSRYSLIMLASKRAHELDAGATPMLTEYESVKNVGRALEEVVAGKLKIKSEGQEG